MYNNYPYTDFSELNLDWFLGQFKELTEAWDAQKVDYEQFKLDVTTEFNTLSGKFDNLKDAFDTLYDYVHDYFDDLNVQQEVNNKLDAMVLDGTLKGLLQPMFDDFTEDTNDRMDVLEGRMDAFSTLAEGSTTGDAELMDIRVGANGITYPNAGDAVRGQVDELQDQINDCKNELGLDITYEMPAPYQSASYRNATNTKAYIYEYGKLHLRIVNNSTGEVAHNEVTSNSASISVSASSVFEIDLSVHTRLKFNYETTFDTDVSHLALRYYNSDLSTNRSIDYPLPDAEGNVSLDLVQLAIDNNVNPSTFSKVFLRGISYVAHTAAASEAADIYIKGFSEGGGATLAVQVDENTDKIKKIENKPSGVDGNIFRYDPTYAHLFINTVSDAESDTYVPSQSLYDIQISKRLGFKVIEANVHVLTDDNYIVLHGVSNKFGPEFAAKTGSTYTDAQIQDTLIASVDLTWIRTNVCYKAKYGKLKVSPPTLEEFLTECKKASIIPLIQYRNTAQIAIADTIMGKDNYILYGAPGSVRSFTRCLITPGSHLSTESDISDWIDGVGNPCMFVTTGYEDFTLSEWADIVEMVHSKGALIGYVYMTEERAQNLNNLGFDVCGSAYTLNPVLSGNLANISSDDSFSDFTVTGGTVSNAQASMNANGTIKLASALQSCYLSGSWLDITFEGSISVSMGRWITHGNTYTSGAGEKMTVHLSTYALDAAPAFEIKAVTSGTKIDNIVFKASKL